MMSTPAEEARPDAASSLVALGLFLYYCTPLVARAVAGRPFDPLMVVLLVAPAVIALAVVRWLDAHPVAVVTAVCVALFLSAAALGACWIVQLRLARGPVSQLRVLGTGALLLVTKAVALVWFFTSPHVVVSALIFEFTVAAVTLIVATLTGFLVRSRRSEGRSRLEAQEARHAALEARLEQARAAERERIAREMHDVVAHRISLIALHAGGLVHRRDLDTDQMREVAEMIQGNARDSLSELRTVLGTLRNPLAAPEAPQPSLSELEPLLSDAQEAGQRVDVDLSGDLRGLETALSRQAYRIVQEALTNARKHAPGAPVSLIVEATPTALAIQVSNPLADLADPASGAGLGLVGVAERVAALGGSVSHGVVRGRFLLDVTLPRGGGA